MTNCDLWLAPRQFGWHHDNQQPADGLGKVEAKGKSAGLMPFLQDPAQLPDYSAHAALGQLGNAENFQLLQLPSVHLDRLGADVKLLNIRPG